eukprot:GGOE01020636.1.p1 GENE.GGOE01020636.1~~GGOE01020636.1.p1  ORF type:complete len:560 (+),score=118.86 GGOE01020636.1:32-1681(+)
MVQGSYYTMNTGTSPSHSYNCMAWGLAASAVALAGLMAGSAAASSMYSTSTTFLSPTATAMTSALSLPQMAKADLRSSGGISTPRALTAASDGLRSTVTTATAVQPSRDMTMAGMTMGSAAAAVLTVVAALGGAIGGFLLGRHGSTLAAAPHEDSVERRIAIAAHLGTRDAGLLPYTQRRTRLQAVATGDLGACHNGKFLTVEQKRELEHIAHLIGTPGKGITACDEGPATIGSRFEAVGIVNTEENRRLYRQMLFEAPGSNQFLSAAILDPETVFQRNDSGKPFPEVLMDRNIVPGVKPHLKVYELPGQSGSTVMQGLDSLAARCREYRAAGCRFAKWRSPLTIDVAAGQPSDMVIAANMTDLARYALICQAEGLVPIVEPDISISGDHDLETAVYVNVKVQAVLYKAMLDHGVFMEGTILKSNMVNPGKRCPITYTVEDIARANVDVLRRCFPVAICSANFLSGGQSLEDAAARLSAINRMKGNCPWNLSFSWSAALQLPLFQLCKGKGQLCLPEMAELYLRELEVASKAARGELIPHGSAGAHVPK